MNTQISIPIFTSQFLELAAFLRENDDPRDPVEMVSVAIEYWIDNASWKPDDLLHKPKVGSLGYIWKSLFLPHGTEIRMTYKGRNYRAHVMDDQFIYDGEPSSPGAMVNTVSGTSRNAWRDLWIKRPDDKDWVSALRCRPSSNRDQ